MSTARRDGRPALHLALLLLTLLSTFSAYLIHFSAAREAPSFTALPQFLRANPIAVYESLVFALALVAILGSHEMGHYLLARRHQVDSTLPYFIPVPLMGFGTLGAVIRIRGKIPDRNALVDIGAAGPLAGLVIAIPTLAVGLALSRVDVIPPMPPQTFPAHGSLIVVFRELMHSIAGTTVDTGPEPTGMVMGFGNNLLTLGLQRLIIGPLPAGHDVIVHPLFLAGWFGLLVTMLNLMPLGQLDGGHLAHALFGEKAMSVGKAVAVGMGFFCLCYSASWLLWLIITSAVVGFRHPPVVDEQAPLSPARKWICLLCAVALILCVMPVPIEQILVQ
ncbi:MAG: site-2 protease family protein [Myxococcaceae bacterium]